MSTRSVTAEKPLRWIRTDLRLFVSNWQLFWFAMLLLVALALPALPIDETRYLAVAWEMYLRLDIVVLHLNGEPYADKGPFLFWLVHLLWLFFKPHVWIVRVAMLSTALFCVWMTQKLSLRLSGSVHNARTAALIFAGMLFVNIFSSAVMFDFVLTACVLVALHGVLDLDAGYGRFGMFTVAIAGGFGILTKGPVALLPIACVLAMAPYWSNTARTHLAQWYGAMVASLLGAIVLALAWAIPAAMSGGPEYAHAIFLGQTMGRVTHSFAHDRPVWWYSMVLPAMLLPWSVSLHPTVSEPIGSFFSAKSVRFAVAWFAPAILLFCAISGKQAHYLLPLLPALAILLAQLIDGGWLRVNGLAFGGLLLAVAGFGLILPTLSTDLVGNSELVAALREANPGWFIGLAGLSVPLLSWPTLARSVFCVTFTSTAASLLCMLGAAQVYGPRVNLSLAAERIREAQALDQPIAFLGSHHGVFELAGRLVTPLEEVSAQQLAGWCATHPSGQLLTFYSKYAFEAKPSFEAPFAFGTVRFFDAAPVCGEVLARQKLT